MQMEGNVKRMRTTVGCVNWEVGKLDQNAVTVFTKGYCSNFARVLWMRQKEELKVCCFIENGFVNHWYLCDNEERWWYDIEGKHEMTEEDRERSDIDVGVEELRYDWVPKDDRYAEAVMDEWVGKYLV